MVVRRQIYGTVDNVMSHKSFRQKTASRHDLCVGYDQRCPEGSGKDGEGQHDAPGREPELFCVDGSLNAQQAVQQDQNAKCREQVLIIKFSACEHYDDPEYEQECPAGKVVLERKAEKIFGEIPCYLDNAVSDQDNASRYGSGLSADIRYRQIEYAQKIEHDRDQDVSRSGKFYLFQGYHLLQSVRFFRYFFSSCSNPQISESFFRIFPAKSRPPVPKEMANAAARAARIRIKAVFTISFAMPSSFSTIKMPTV